MELLLSKHAGPNERLVIESRIRNQHGLHPRLACEFVRCANRFQSTLTLKVAGRIISARNVSELLQANLAEGTSFTIVAEGPDAKIAGTDLDTFLRHLVIVEDPASPEHRSLC